MNKENLKHIIRLSIPPALSMLIQSLYNLVDSIFVTHYDELAMEAVSLVYPIQNIILAIGLGIGIGINAYCSTKRGEGKLDETNNGASLGVITSIIHYFIVLIVGLFTARLFVTSFTNNQLVIDYALTYINLIIIFSFTTIIQIALEKILQADGKMMYPMISLLTGSIINIILDPILIFTFDLGILGAAIATVVGQVAATLVMIYFIISPKNTIRVSFRHLKFDKNCLKTIYYVGIPSILLTAIPSLMVSSMNYILITINSLAVTTFGIYYKLQYFVYMAISGISQGTMPLIAYNIGANDKKRFKDTVNNSLFLSVVIGFISMIIFLIIPGPLMSLFYDNPSESINNLLRIASLSFVFGGLNYMYASYFQASQSGAKSLLVALLRQLILILPFAYILSIPLDEFGVYLSIPISELLTFIVISFIFYKDYRNHLI